MATPILKMIMITKTKTVSVTIALAPIQPIVSTTKILVH